MTRIETNLQEPVAEKHNSGIHAFWKMNRNPITMWRKEYLNNLYTQN